MVDDRLTKQDVINSIAQISGLDKKQSTAALNALTETIENSLSQGKSIGLVGFGTFEVKERAAREGRNPQTGDKIQISAKKIPSFRAGKQLRNSVGNSSMS